MNQRLETLIRIAAFFISGFVLEIWSALVGILAVINGVLTIFTGKRNISIAEFCEIWNI